MERILEASRMAHIKAASSTSGCRSRIGWTKRQISWQHDDCSPRKRPTWGLQLQFMASREIQGFRYPYAFYILLYMCIYTKYVCVRLVFKSLCVVFFECQRFCSRIQPFGVGCICVSDRSERTPPSVQADRVIQKRSSDTVALSNLVWQFFGMANPERYLIDFIENGRESCCLWRQPLSMLLKRRPILNRHGMSRPASLSLSLSLWSVEDGATMCNNCATYCAVFRVCLVVFLLILGLLKACKKLQLLKSQWLRRKTNLDEMLKSGVGF